MSISFLNKTCRKEKRLTLARGVILTKSTKKARGKQLYICLDQPLQPVIQTSFKSSSWLRLSSLTITNSDSFCYNRAALQKFLQRPRKKADRSIMSASRPFLPFNGLPIGSSLDRRYQGSARNPNHLLVVSKGNIGSCFLGNGLRLLNTGMTGLVVGKTKMAVCGSVLPGAPLPPLPSDPSPGSW